MGRPKINIGVCTTEGCNKPKHSRGLCNTCYKRLNYEEYGRDNRGATRQIIAPLLSLGEDGQGYITIKIGMGRGPKDWMKYHRYLMEQKLGRKLFSFESVHHKNGNKKDNVLSNLELWVTKQPKGQRPIDLIEYAEWIIKTYKNEQQNTIQE